MVKVHHDTVDMYLEDVILNSINLTADAQAREEIHLMAEELNNITYAMEERYVCSTKLKLVIHGCHDIQLVSEIPRMSESQGINNCLVK